MFFIFFVIIIFIAELIITFTILFNLLKFDICIKKINMTLVEIKPKIKEIMVLIYGISEQIKELTPIWIEKIRDTRNLFVKKQFESLMSSILFWVINVKVIKRLKKSKLVKFAWKGLTLLQNML